MAEEILSRAEYVKEFSGMLIERFRYHPLDAAHEAEMAMQEFAETQTDVWGDPDYSWDRDSAREHAFNWIDGPRREKHQHT